MLRSNTSCDVNIPIVYRMRFPRSAYLLRSE